MGRVVVHVTVVGVPIIVQKAPPPSPITLPDEFNSDRPRTLTRARLLPAQVLGAGWEVARAVLDARVAAVHDVVVGDGARDAVHSDRVTGLDVRAHTEA